MADISKITIGSGTYDVKDEKARNIINVNDNMYLGCFFDPNDSNKLVLKLSKDAKNFQTIKKLNIVGRDPSIIYYHGYFYIAVTNFTASRDLIIYKSSDLINFETNYVTMGLLSWDARWAPEFYVEDDNVKLLISAREESDGKFKILISDIDLSTFECSNMSDITPGSDISFIDPQLIKIEDTYYLTVSDQSVLGESYVYIYSSSTIGNWSLVNSNVFKTCQHVEGSYILPISNRFLIYGDPAYISGIIYVDTNNLATTDSIGQPRDNIISINGLWDVKHGSVMECNSNELKDALYNLIDVYNINPNYISEKMEMYHNISVVNETKDHEWFCDKTLITIGGNGLSTIKKLYNPFRAKEIKIAFMGASTATFKIEQLQDCQGSWRTINRTFSNSEDLNEKVFTQITNSISPISNDYTE